MNIKLNKFCKDYLALWALLIIVTFLTGCSSMPIETIDDKIANLMLTVPEGVTVEFKERDYFAGLLAGKSGYYNQFSKTIYSIYNPCVVEHEIYHARHGLGHDHFPDRLMECRV
jgi:hypothetical protein